MRERCLVLTIADEP